MPLAPIAESEGTLVNLDGAYTSFSAAGRARGDARPGWKILRLIGSDLGLEGFGQINAAEVLEEARTEIGQAEVSGGEPSLAGVNYEEGLYRIGELPMYSIDALCRRSEPLQETAQANSLFLGLNPADAARLGLGSGDRAKIRQGEGQVEMDVRISDRVPAGGAWLRSATGATAGLGSAYAPVTVEVV